jgi:hypothetical protein
MEIRESQIEDILVNSPLLAKNVLGLDEEPRLLVRQMILPSGRLDLLYTYQTKLLLVELKVESFQKRFVQQVFNYRQELNGFQTQGRLIHGDIHPYLLCTTATDQHKAIARAQGVICQEYKPEDILQFFYKNFKPIASFFNVKPIDIGIWNIHLINKFIYFLEQINSVRELRKLVGGSPRTLYNKIKFAAELRLVNWKPNSDKIFLSELGTEYVSKKDIRLPERLSEAQAELLKNFIMQNPYDSSVILGFASVVESVFALSKNIYPVPMEHLMRYFTLYAGKHFDWQTEKAKYNATHMYLNYAIDIGLLGKSGESIYISPEGIKFTMQMQLHKSLKMIDSVKLV